MTLDSFFAAIDSTWPAARLIQQGPLTLRQGLGGGQRVSAATAQGNVTADDIPIAETAMRDMGQTPLFMIRPGESELDSLLAARGYLRHDATSILTCPTASLTNIPIPRVTVFSIWEPLAIMREIWAKGGIDANRLAMMERARGPKTGLFGRWNEKPAGVGYVGLHDNVAMVHAVEVLPHQRRQGVAQWIMRAAAFWAADHGADTMAVLCTEQNDAAQSLYAGLAMTKVGGYHYRKQPIGGKTDNV